MPSYLVETYLAPWPADVLTTQHRKKEGENTMKTWLTFGGGLAALAAALAFAAGAAAAIPSVPGNPVVNGCPAGFEAIQVADFPAQYRVPGGA